MNRDFLLEQSLKLLFPLFLMLALLAFWRGHHLPGGGFIGGLLATLALVIRSLPEGATRNKFFTGRGGEVLLALGVALAALAALLAPLMGEPFFKGLWMDAFTLPLIGKIHLGTPLLFDLGVMIAVTSFGTKTILHFLELD
jgi:multisubunit Na+/H+ antiporter MnhB subunit